MQSDGFVVDYAICTTYSLDMPTLLSVPFMLGTMSDMNEAIMHSPHLLLEAINKSTGKFAVFCNAGCIYVPTTNLKVYSLLERSVVQISLAAKGAGFINFHPKVLIIKESNPDTEQQQIKVAVLSRNLTNSNDLDVVCEMTGIIGKKQATLKERNQHQPLIDFLSWLRDKTNDRSIRKNISTICSDIKFIESFELKNSPFDDYEFFPMGIKDYDGYYKCFTERMLDHAAEMVIISPFIDSDTIKQITNCCPKAKKTLVTRHESLTQNILSMFNDGVYVPKEVLTDKEEKDIAVNLHEKVYFIRNYQTCINSLFIGSANATRNGFERNVEFLLKLSYTPYKMSYDKFRSDLISDSSDCMFEKVVSVSNEEKSKEDATDELLLRQAISSIQKAQINMVDEKYEICILCSMNKIPDSDIYIYPLGCDEKKTNIKDNLIFNNMELSLLTEFYVIGIGNLKRVIKIETTGMPIEDRDKAIFRSYINTKGKFISYLAFMLTNDVQQYIAENQQIEKDLADGSKTSLEQEISTSLYEDMVRMAYTQPERIASIRQVIDKANETVIPDHFVKMYTKFEDVIKQIKRIKHYEYQRKRFPKGNC